MDNIHTQRDAIWPFTYGVMPLASLRRRFLSQRGHVLNKYGGSTATALLFMMIIAAEKGKRAPDFRYVSVSREMITIEAPGT